MIFTLNKKEKKMKKIQFLIILCFVGIVQTVTAQSDSLVHNTNIKREKFRLAVVESNSIDNELKAGILKKDQLQLLLSHDQFRAYKHARRCYHASIPLLSLSACGIAVTCMYLGIGIHDIRHRTLTQRLNHQGGLAFAVSFIFFTAGTLPYLISGVTLIVYSKKKLDNIAESYNKQYHSSFYHSNIRMNFGFTQNGIGLKLTF